MTPIVYNLFPRLVGPTDRWAEHAGRAAEMGFDWLYLNPWHYPGFSGSLYAPKDFQRLNPLFLPAGEEERTLEPLRRALAEIRDAGLRPMMDLVVNHTARDALLTGEHPEWYVRDDAGALVSPSVVDPDDPSKVTVWGDLAEVDNAGASDRGGLWEYWADRVREALALGFQGFRCDAAYKVPTELWRYLVHAARAVDPRVEFFAETLGAPLQDVLALREAGFDYIFNSTKWWDFRQSWALEQHERLRRVAPSISFPETHDTARLAEDTGGNEAIQRQRYAFAAAFSAGVMMPVGYEFGFRRRVDVVHTMPSDWERPSFDLRPMVARVNRLKRARVGLQGEPVVRAPRGLEEDVLLLDRVVEPSGARAWILVNKSAEPRETEPPAEAYTEHRLFRVCRDGAPEAGEALPDGRLRLEPFEVAYVLAG